MNNLLVRQWCTIDTCKNSELVENTDNRITKTDDFLCSVHALLEKGKQDA